MKKIITTIIIVLGLTCLMGLSFSNRAIETTDYIIIKDQDRGSHKVRWTAITAYTEAQITALSNDITLTGGIDASGQLDFQEVLAAGTSNGHIVKITQAAGLTYTGTMAGLTVKNYDADGTVVHGSGENTGLAVFMKQLSASGAGGENSLMSLHSHSSALGTLDHGIIIYPDSVGSCIAVRAATVGYGLDFDDVNNVTITGAELRCSNGETIDNVTDGVINIPSKVRVSTINFADATAVAGSGDAITIDFIPNLGTIEAGSKVTFVAEAANTGATTLNIDGVGAINVYEASDVSALDANDIRSGMVVELIYDGTQWQQVSQSGN